MAARLTDGLVAFIILIGLQILLSWRCATSHRMCRIVNLLTGLLSIGSLETLWSAEFRFGF